MTSLVHEVRLAFDLASLRHEAGRDLSAGDWGEYRRINETYASRRSVVERDFTQTYGERVADVRRRLIDEAGSRTLDLVPRLMGRDRFDHSVIERQAHREVHLAHRSTLGRIDREEAEAIEGLLARAGRTDKARDNPLRDFTRATERRGGVDRRRRHR